MVVFALTRWTQPKPAPADPFRALAVQARLTCLTDELERLDRPARVGGRGYAPGFHLRAALLAYEGALREACRLAGIDVEVEGSAGRLIAEVALREAGWSW